MHDSSRGSDIDVGKSRDILLQEIDQTAFALQGGKKKQSGGGLAGFGRFRFRARWLRRARKHGYLASERAIEQDLERERYPREKRQRIVCFEIGHKKQ